MVYSLFRRVKKKEEEEEIFINENNVCIENE